MGQRRRGRGNPLRRLERRVFRVGGVRTRVYVATSVAARVDDRLPTFVLVHGLGVSSRYFVPLAERLSQHGSVVVFDLPGSGGLPHPRRAMSVAQFAAVVAGVADELGVRHPVVLGHSMGAQIAVELMASRPERFRAGLLLGPVVNAAERRLSTVLWRFAQSAVHERPSNAALALKDYAVAGLSWPNLLLPVLLGYRIEERIASVAGCLALMAGDRDATAPRAWLEELARSAAGASVVEVVVVEGAAHQLVVGHADRVAEHAVTLAGCP